MADRAAQLRSLFDRQKQEMDGYVASFLEAESKAMDHEGSWDESMSTTAKLEFSRMKSELEKSRDDIVKRIDTAKKRMEATKSLLRMLDADGSGGTSMKSGRIPVLPTFRAPFGNTEKDAFEFLDKCKALLEANQIEEARWLPAILPALSSFDRQWASANLKGLKWDELEKKFISHFETPALRDRLMKELMTIALKRRESVQQYSDRFTSLMRRTGKSDSDDTLIAVYINGLDSRLQEMMHVARATNLNMRHASGQTVHESVGWEIQNAIALDAARNTGSASSKLQTTSDSSANAGMKPRCGKCHKLGHTTEQHIDDFRPTSTRSQMKGKESVNEKKCFKCGGPWIKGHKCSDTVNPQNSNMEIEGPCCEKDISTVDISTGISEEISGHAQDDYFQDQLAAAIMQSDELNTAEMAHDSEPLIFTPVTINGIPARAMVDSGASAMFIAKAFIEKNGFSVEKRSGIIKNGMGEKLSDRTGIAPVEVRNGSKIVQCTPDVLPMPNGRDLVIGLSHFTDFGFHISGVPVKKPEEEISDITANTEAFDEPQVDGLTAEELHQEVSEATLQNGNLHRSAVCPHPLAVLELNPTDSSPIWRHINFVNGTDKERVTEIIHEWLRDQVIEIAPAECVNCFSVLAVPKKNAFGQKTDVRPCIDLRPLNTRIAEVNYPMPKVQEILDGLGSASGVHALYTTLDIRDSYFRFRIPERSRNWIAFKWNRVHYRFTRAPFGVKTMTSLFQRLMDKILADLPFAQCYVDDIIVFSNCRADHVEHVKAVLDRLTHWKLPIKLAKCRFGQKMVRVLGFIVSGNGINMDPAKTEAIGNWTKPKTVKQLLRFLGVANYYRQFIKGYSSITAPLDALRKTKGVIAWSNDQSSAFSKLKGELAKNVTLAYPDDAKTYVICTDASDVGIGAWIGQRCSDTMRVICFASRSLSKSEANYSPTKKELLAIIWSLQKFSGYVYGRRFTLMTDHRALTYLFSQKNPNRMMIEWFDTLLAHDFDIIHVAGKHNVVADGLSRMFETTSFNALTRAHVIRDKTEPTTEAAKKAAIEKAHSFGHFGEQAIFQKLWHEGFWWKSIREDIRAVTSSCTPCLRYNVQRKGFHPLKIISASLPWDHVAIDLVVNIPRSEDGKDTLLVIVDIMTKFAILRCLKGKSMAAISKSLWEVISVFGVPKIIQSDNGTEFVNQLVRQLVKLQGINHRTTSAYNPRANGAVERTNGIIETMLKKELRGKITDWPAFVPFVQLAYNAKISSTTGSSPFALMFGRALNDFSFYKRTSKAKGVDLALWKTHQEKVFNTIYPAVCDRVKDKKADAVKFFSEKARIIPSDFFPPGCQVMMRDATRASKWDPIYEGPFTIVRRNQGGAYVLKDKVGEILKRTVPADQLKLVTRAGENAVFAAPSLKIRKILSHRSDSINRHEYLVHWKDKHVSDSWEPVENFDDIAVIKEYWKSTTSEN